eukprot:gnl/TRDRNA2_/TRDRNA2_154184_c2_seq2.p1 gnl/TRDRNA2_/TRDRNA2_154184_c2~~gnl/TRDRNA2_/TRDRNA2_154184_c2_seq2.p1  ORF type:complete len:197 (+),score=33.17 gnl/TRDRNA2_/TRDRNA2_154184_c2_seq2:62-652(+)
MKATVGWNHGHAGIKVWVFLEPDGILAKPLAFRAREPWCWGKPAFGTAYSSRVDLFDSVSEGATIVEVQSAAVAALRQHVGKDLRVLTAVQLPGETVLIPSEWVHQVYHVTPSVAIAGQHANKALRRTVFGHVLEYCGGVEVDLIDDILASAYKEGGARGVLRAALSARFHGDTDQVDVVWAALENSTCSMAAGVS